MWFLKYWGELYVKGTLDDLSNRLLRTNREWEVRIEVITLYRSVGQHFYLWCTDEASIGRSYFILMTKFHSLTPYMLKIMTDISLFHYLKIVKWWHITHLKVPAIPKIIREIWIVSTKFPFSITRP